MTGYLVCSNLSSYMKLAKDVLSKPFVLKYNKPTSSLL